MWSDIGCFFSIFIILTNETQNHWRSQMAWSCLYVADLKKCSVQQKKARKGSKIFIHPFCCLLSCHIIVSALTKLRWCMWCASRALLSDLNAHAMDQPAANSESLRLWPLQRAQNKVQVSVVQLIYNGEQAVIKCWCHRIPHHSFGESSSLYPNKTNGPLAACNLFHVHVSSNHTSLLLGSFSWLYL